jgi:sugar lactone lactonase YvrE
VKIRACRRVGLLLFMAMPVLASSPATWEMSSYQDFLRGRFENLSLSRDGVISLAPRLDDIFTSGQAVIWSIAEAPDGSLYAGTGNRGRLYRIDKAHRSELVWTADQPEIFAVTVAPDGVVYAAGSPDGRIYRIRNGKADLYFDPHAKYIWTLAVGRDGALYAGTGDEGKVYRITAANTGEEYYATGQSHVTGLSFDRDGLLLAGTEPNGILYRISAKDKAFALYDSSLPEVRAIANGPDGSIYAVAMGGSVNRRTQAAAQAAQAMLQGSTPVVTTSITVTADAARSGNLAPADTEVKPPQSDANKAAQAAVAAATAAQAVNNVQPIEVAGVEKSAIYRIHPDNTVETLWSSKDENVFDLIPRGADILFSTDEGGRIYRLSAGRKLTLLAQTNEGEATRLIDSNGAVFAATGNMGKLFELESGRAPRGFYESPVFDAQSVAKWGHVRWSAHGQVILHTRSGNSVRPDGTWSDWSDPLTDAAGSSVASPNARYIQWKAELAGASGSEPALENFSLAYLPQNTAPVVRSILVTTSAAAAASPQKNTPSGGSATVAYSITVTDTGDAGPSTSTGTPTQTISRASSQQIVVSWQADDPDGDRLVYAVWFRGEGEREWKLLKTGLHDNTVTIDDDSLADGRYYFRVEASDRESNPPGQAREADLISSPVLIDNTPPVLRVTAQKREGGDAVIDFEAADAASPLRRCEYSLDAGPWMALNSVEGIIDSPTERFHLVAPVPPGEHVLVLRAVDSGGNAGLAKVVLK